MNGPRINFLVLLMVFFYTEKSTFGQGYFDFTEEQKKPFFGEEFSKNEFGNFFMICSPHSELKVEDDVLKISPKRWVAPYCQMWSMEYTGITEDVNWEFEMKFSFECMNTSRYFIQIMLGRRRHEPEKDNIYMWIFNKRYKYIFETPFSKRSVKELTGKLDDHMHEGEFNKITVRRVNDQYQFFINEWYCGALEYVPLEASGVIHLRFNKLKMNIDYIRVSVLNSKSE